MMLMADPMIVLLKLQEAVDLNGPIDSSLFKGDYVFFEDGPNGGKRYSYSKVVGREVHALSIFGLSESIAKIACYSVGYAVKESQRGRGLALEAVNWGIEDLKSKFFSMGIKEFYIEALVAQSNIHSIEVANKLFSSPGIEATDSFSGTPSFYFKKLVRTN